MLNNIFRIFLLVPILFFASEKQDNFNKLTSNNQIELTKEEKEWISNNKVRVGVENWAPIIFSNTGKDVDGIAGNVLSIIVKKTGLQVEIKNNLWDILLTSFKNKDIEILPATYYTNTRATYGLYSKSYIKVFDYIYIKDNDNSIKSMRDLNNKKLAIVKGFGTIPKIRNMFPKINIIETTDLNDSIKRVLSGQVDALFDGQIAVEYKLREDLISGIKGVPQTTFKAAKLHFFIRNDIPILKSIIDKAVNSISIIEINKIRDKWILKNSDKKKYNINKNSVESSFFEFISLKKLIIVLFITCIVIYFFYKNYIKRRLLNSKFILFNRIIISFEIILVLLLLFGIAYLDRLENTLAKLHENRFLMTQAVTRLRQSSDDLTHFARSYAVTNDKKFKKQYDLTLGIRNGTHPRPQGYNGIYWDLNKNERIKRHPLLKKEALTEIINRLPFSKDELNKLKESRNNSNKLVAIEKEAFNAIENKDNTLAVKLLHSKEYYDSKHEIMLPIDDFMIMLNKRLSILIEQLENSISNLFSYIFVLMLIFSFGNIFIYLLLRKKTNIPISYLSSTINKIKNNEKVEKKLFYKDEIGETIEQFFIMHNSLQEQQNRLKESQERFSTLFELSPDGITIVNNNKFIECNQKALEIFGVSNKEDFIRSKPSDYSPEFQKDGKYSDILASKEITKAIKNGYNRFEWIHKRADTNESFDTEVILSSIILDSEEHIFAVVRDITERKELEKQILENQEQMTFVSQYANLGFWNFNPQLLDLNVNNTFLNMLDYNIKDNIKKNSENKMFKPLIKGFEFLTELIYPDDLENMYNAINEHLYDKTELYRSEYRIRKKDGSWLWVMSIGRISKYDSNGKPIKFNGVNIDIQEAKEAQEKIAQNKLFVDSLLDSQEQIVITTDGEKLISCNNAFLDFFKIKDIKEFTKDYNSICDRFEEDNTGDYLQKYMQDKTWIEYIISNENLTHKVIIKKDGIDRTFTVTASLLPLDNKLWSAVFTDITELELQKKQTESILSSVLLPMLITSKKTRKIKYANAFAESQYETTKDRLLGLDIKELYSYKGQRDDILKEFESKGSLQNYETRFKTLKGNEFDAIFSLIEIDFGGEDCYLGVASDITEQKNREELIHKLHKNVTDSIEYASLIQHSLVPTNDLFDKYFSDYFTIWYPKDIVGGDIYLFEELKSREECLLMVIDCTGHGVPGAFVTMLVKAIERQIVAIILNTPNMKVSPAWILKYFNQTMKKLLKQEDSESISNAGFDGGIFYYNKKKRIVRYAGAEVPLFFHVDGQFKIIKADRQSIGYKKSNSDYEFNEYELDVKEGMQFYITTDGYIDQNGGEKGFPLGKKRFLNTLEKYKNDSFIEQKNMLIENLLEYQKNEERNDDISVIGIKI